MPDSQVSIESVTRFIVQRVHGSSWVTITSPSPTPPSSEWLEYMRRDIGEVRVVRLMCLAFVEDV